MPELRAAHTRFLQRRNNTLYITELPNQDRAEPTLLVLHEVRELIDRFAEFGLTRGEAHEAELASITDGLDLSPGPPSGTGFRTVTMKITQLVCRYETQQNDQLVEEQFKLIFDKSTELTVPHTRYGLVAHAIGAFLPRCVELMALHVHTCDHSRLLRTIHKIPSLRLTVIRNDASNGFWNAAALALFARLRCRELKSGYNAVVVAHTNASRAFSAPEWALATYLFMRDQVHSGSSLKKQKAHENGEFVDGRRYVLHDFADGAMQQSLDAAFAIVCNVAAETESKIRGGVDNPRLAFVQQPADSDQRIEYSSISPASIVFAARGRNVFTPYIEQFPKCPPVRMQLTDNREVDLTPRQRAERAEMNLPPIEIRTDLREIEQPGHPCIVFGRATFTYTGADYNIEHDLLLIKYREVLGDEKRILIREVRPKTANYYSSQVIELDVYLARKLRQQMPPLLPRVHIESENGGIPASRELLLQGAVQHLVLDFRCDNNEDGINHDNPNHGLEHDAFVSDEVIRPVTSNLYDICGLITEMRRLDKLTIALKFQFEDPEELHVGSNQMRTVLNSVVAAQCGIPRLEILNAPGGIADVCLLHLMHRTDACLLMDLAIEVRARPDEAGVDEEENIAEIALQNVIGERAGVIGRQLLSLTINSRRPQGSTYVRMDYLPDLLDACTGLRHLSLDLQHFHTRIRQQVQAAILRMAGRLHSFQFRSNSDSMTDNTSFTAAFLRAAVNAVFVRFDVTEIPRGINEVADALGVCLLRPIAEQINVTCHYHDAFSASQLNRLYFAARERGGSNVGMCFRANFNNLTSATQAARLLDERVTFIARHRNRETNDPLADYRSYRTPSNNDVFVEIAIEQAFQRLQIDSTAGAGAAEPDDSKAQAAAADDDDGTNRAENLSRRDYASQMAARQAAQADMDRRNRLGAYRIRDLTSDNQDLIDAGVQASKAAFTHASRTEIAECIAGMRQITIDVRSRHPDIDSTKTKLAQLLESPSGTDADAKSLAFARVYEQLERDAATDERQQQECDDEMERQGKCYLEPVQVESQRVPWTTTTGRQLGAFVPFAGERMPLTLADRRDMNAVTWAVTDPEDLIPTSDPRGDIVIMTQAQQYALETQLRIDQLHRTLWLFAIAEEIRTSPATTVQLHNFAPEVPMAASRAAYQAYYTAPTSTLGCVTFGRFFNQDGFALQGFPAPGSRTQDAHAALRVARYPMDIVPGPRAIIFRGGRRVAAMQYQVDNYGVAFDNEHVAHQTAPARYTNATPVEVPLVGDLLRRAINPNLTANAVLHTTFEQIANLTPRFPSGTRQPPAVAPFR